MMELLCAGVWRMGVFLWDDFWLVLAHACQGMG